MNLVIKTEQNQRDIVDMLDSMGIEFEILYTCRYEGIAEVYNCRNVPDVLPDNFIVATGNKIAIKTETTLNLKL